MTLPYFEVHEGSGPYLLMVHGILSSRAQWQQNLEALKEVSSPVVLELYGHGRSPSPSEREYYSPNAYVSAFEKIRSLLGTEKWFVLGYSLGAGLTINYCLEHPERIHAAAFTNSTSAFADEAAKKEFTENSEAIIQRYESGGMTAIESIPVHPKYAKKLLPAIKEALLEDCERLDPGGVARTIVYTNGYSSVRNRIQDNQTPTLLLHGEKESRFQPLKQHAEAHMPHLEIIDLPAGHAVNAEAPDAFNQAIVQFLKKHSPGKTL